MLDRVNRVVKYMVLSDLLLFAGWGFISPIFSVFVLENIAGATLTTVGISSAIYWMARAMVQPPVAKMLDKRKGEKDDYFTLLISLVGIGLVAFWIASIEQEGMLYLAQAFHGVSFGVYSVVWPAIFTRHMDKGRVAFDWSLDHGSIALVVAFASIVGAKVAELLGFEMVFILAGTGSIIAALTLMVIPQLIFPKVSGVSSRLGDVQAHRKHKGHNPIGF